MSDFATPTRAPAGDSAGLPAEESSPPKTSNARLGRTITRLVLTVIGLVLAAMLINLLVTSDTLHWDVVRRYFTEKSVLEGLLRTIQLTVIAMAMGIVLGVVLALMKMSGNMLLAAIASGYIWLFRGTPLLVQIIFWYNLASFMPRLSLGVPFGPSFASWDVNSIVTPLSAALLALGLNEGAYMAEIVRAGISSVDHGQSEAALVLGMTKAKAMRRIVLPQAIRIIIPPTGNQAIGLLKGTALVSVISTPELLYSVEIIYAQNFLTIPLLIVASLWYLVLTTIFSIGQYFLERHYARGSFRAMPLTPWQKLLRWFTSHGLSTGVGPLGTRP